ncbi:hypothetical protein [Microbispora sp. H13382]|uniref:hypothetical protein n=1 Tax=Microbispora sp. H13382 TaxID=2729112 RepID=UPI0015FF0A74|nr:hypothetical protein [Microbispora sp. H13382]
MATAVGFIPYATIQEEFSQHALRSAEVPVEHYVSAPLPTLRWGTPAYAVFICPAARVRGMPPRLDAPDRWWAISAESRRSLVYALTKAVPYTPEPLTGPVVLSPTGRSLAALKEDARVLGELLDEAVPGFFRGEAVAAELREDLAAQLRAVLPGEVWPWHRALTPDLFAWLEGADHA